MTNTKTPRTAALVDGFGNDSETAQIVKLLGNSIQLETELNLANEQREELLAALEDVREWISNWDPNFIHDDEWPATKEKMNKAIAKCEVSHETK